MSCTVCDAEVKIETYKCEVAPHQGKELLAHRCTGCDFIFLPENTGHYVKVLASEHTQGEFRKLRNANEERPGREFYMAEMGMEIQGGDAPSVSFFGSGLNTDHIWVKSKYPKVSTKLVDLENMQAVENFESIEMATPSDVVIACEVIEHFEEPLDHFESLIQLLKPNGILICCTNVYDGTDIRRHQYPFVPGHVSYWSPLALIKVATDHGCFIDFRTPEMGMHRGGPRKKYVIFYRNIELLFRISHYFGSHRLAPSEKE